MTGVKDPRWEVIWIVPVAQSSHMVLKAADSSRLRGRDTA